MRFVTNIGISSCRLPATTKIIIGRVIKKKISVPFKVLFNFKFDVDMRKPPIIHIKNADANVSPKSFS